MSVGGAPPTIELVPTRRLLAASLELLSRSTVDMRRASFYIGVLTLGTVGPLVLLAWAVSVAAVGRAPSVMEATLSSGLGAVLTAAGGLAFVGWFVTLIESRALAVALLGGHYSGDPISPRQALARSRRVFWRVVVAGLITGIVLGLAQLVVTGAVTAVVGENDQLSLLVSTAAGAIIGAPFAYVLAGVVLGDVEPMEAIRRSVRVFRARRLAAVLVVVIEAVAFLLIFLGASAGLDIAVRLLDTLGLGTDSGPAGLLLITIGVVALVFAAGTLLFTVMAITLAPQVVMFVGLTHATMGLDRVRPGGRDDPERARPPFRTLTMPVIIGFGIGVVLLVAGVAGLIWP